MDAMLPKHWSGVQVCFLLFGITILMIGHLSMGLMAAKIELYYLDRGVLEANLGPLEELYKTRKTNAEKNGIVKKISFEELEVIGLLGTGQF